MIGRSLTHGREGDKSNFALYNVLKFKKRKLMKALSFLAVIFAGFIIFAVSTQGKQNENFLKFDNGAEPKSLDPHVATGVPEGRIIENIYEGLTTLRQKDLTVAPGMAESWELSENNTVYTFKIRKNAKWSNGDPLTAHDFVNSWRRMLRLNPISEYMTMLFDLVGAEDYAKKKHHDFDKVGVKAVDNHTLIVTLNAATPYFLEKLAHYTMYPVHNANGAICDAKTKKKVNITNQTNVEFIVDPNAQTNNKVISNGAFELKHHVINDMVVIERNPHYYDYDNVKLEGVIFRPIAQADTALLLYKGGNLDYITNVPLDALPILMKENSPDFKLDAYLGTYYFRFNVTAAPFDDVRVRKAFCHAIDKSRITKRITQSGEIPTDAMCPPGMAGYTPATGLAFDVEKAKKLLSEAGYPGGKGFKKVEILFNTSENHQKITLEIAQMLRKNLNIEVEMVNKEWKVYLDDQAKLKYQISRSGWIGDYSDPHTFLSIMMTDDGNNRTGWSNDEYDKLMRQSSLESDPIKRMALMQKAEKIMVQDDVPIIPIFHYISKSLVNPRIEGWLPNVRDRHPFKDFSIKQ